MTEQEPVSAPLSAEASHSPWWKQRLKRRPRKRKAFMNRRGNMAGKTLLSRPQAQSQSTDPDDATQATFSNAASNVVPATTERAKTFKKRQRRRRKPRLLVLDSWVIDGTNGQSLDASGDDNELEEEEEVILDSWEDESLKQQPSTTGSEEATDEDGGCGQDNSNGHVTTDDSSSISAVQPDQGLLVNKRFQRKIRLPRAQQNYLTVLSKKMRAPVNTETAANVNPPVKLASPLLKTTPPPLLGLALPPIESTSLSVSNIAPSTTTADVLKNLPPFAGLTSVFDSSLSDPIHVPTDRLSTEQPTYYPSQPHSSISNRPLPLLNSGNLTNRGNPFMDTISTSPMPLLMGGSLEEISDHQCHDPLQLLGYNTSSTLTSSGLNSDILLTTASNSSFTHPSSSVRKTLLPTPLLPRSPPPTLREGGGGGAPSRQLKITSFLSPPKKKRLDDPVRLEPGFSTSLSFTMPSVSRTGLSTRPPPLSPERTEYSEKAFLPPIAPPRDRYLPLSELGKGSVPLSKLSNQDSIFNRLDSSNKYRQSRLQFSTDQSQHSLEQALPRRDIHDDPFSRLGPSVTNLNALSMSQFGDSYATGGNTSILSPPESDQRRPHPHTDCLHLPMDSVISRQATDVTVAKLEPNIEYEEDNNSSFSSSLYQTRLGPGRLNVTKVLSRYAPKRYQPSASSFHGLVKQDRQVSSMDSREISSSGGRFVDIQDSVRNVQQISGPSRNSSERTVTEAGVSLIDNDGIGQDDATNFQIGDDELDYSQRHVESTTGIHIPLSRKGLKVVAIDCEMVGCKRKIPHEQLLASYVKGTTKGGAVKAMLANEDGGGGGLGGVLQKTKMKPQILTRNQRKKLKQKQKGGLNKEISVAARCSIIAYDGTVLYDKYINPTVGTNYVITDYRTRWSGIKPSHMTGATPYHMARQEVLDILRGCIVVGHNISSDVKSLEIHNNIPASKIRDTSFHRTLVTSAGGSRALKTMAHVLLGREIQKKSRTRVGHCSVEDATATMDLYKLVELEWEM